ncbi:MAG: PDZ domain-containing protein [Planctomycetota bacterium]|nr:PDZ domain-containing protein [Planctomycetota bacterium]
MNIGQIKVWAWATAAVLTIGLSWYVFDFVRKLPELEKGPDTKAVREVLEAVPPMKTQTDRLMTYEQAKKVLALNDWTGMPKPKVVEKPVDGPPAEIPKTPVKDLVKVISITCDLSEPAKSFIQVRYLPLAGVGTPTAVLRTGDVLAPQHRGITVEAIEPSIARFKFSDEREPEDLSCQEFDAKSEIVVVDVNGDVILPRVGATIPKTGENFIPGSTMQIGRNSFRLGLDDMKRFNDDYARILGTEVQTAQHRDARTGKYDGIEIKSIQPGSIASRHGAQEGDVVKSINGHPVNTTNEAITFVKTNKDKYSSWDVVIENKGKSRTVTYNSGGN